MTRSLLMLPLLLAVPVLSGCNTQAGSAENPERAQGKLAGTPEWVLTKLTIDGEDHSPRPGVRATVTFKGKKFTGNSGCNHFDGTYSAKADGTFGVSEWMTTEIGCDHLAFEAKYVDAFTKATKYEVGEKTLVLSDGTDANRLEYVPFEPNHLPLAGTEWKLTHFTESDAVTETATVVLEKHPITLKIEEGKVAGSGGCNRYFGGVTFPKDGELKFGAIGATKRACIGPGMPQESKYFTTLAKMTKYRVNESVLTMENADGTLGLQFSGKKPQ